MDETSKWYAIWKKADTKECLIPLTWNTWNKQIYRDKEQINGFQGLRPAKIWSLAANESKVSFWDDENILQLDTGNSCTLWMY